MKKETTIIITTSITVQSESDVPQDEIVCSVKNALRVDNSKLLDSLTLMEEEQTDDELVSEHELSTVSQEDFNKAFNEILDGSTLCYLDPETGLKVSEKETSHIRILTSKCEWLINYDTNSRKPHFWYNYERVYCVLQYKYSLQDGEMHQLLKSLVETQYKMKGVTPHS